VAETIYLQPATAARKNTGGFLNWNAALFFFDFFRFLWFSPNDIAVIAIAKPSCGI